MRKTVFTRLLSTVAFFSSVAAIGSWVAPDVPRRAIEHLGSFLQSGTSLANTPLSVPIWVLALLAVGFFLVFNLGYRIRDSKNPLRNLSFPELQVLNTLISLDGASITCAKVASLLHMSNLEAETTLSKLKSKSLVTFFMTPIFSGPGGVVGGEMEYTFTEEGRELSIDNLPKLKAALEKRTN